MHHPPRNNNPTPTKRAHHNAPIHSRDRTVCRQVVVCDSSCDLFNDERNKYLYDGEGRICAVFNGATGTQYIYDAEGKRVAKGSINVRSCDTSSNGFTPTSSYIVGQSGEQVTETDASVHGCIPMHTQMEDYWLPMQTTIRECIFNSRIVWAHAGLKRSLTEHWK